MLELLSKLLFWGFTGLFVMVGLLLRYIWFQYVKRQDERWEVLDGREIFKNNKISKSFSDLSEKIEKVSESNNGFNKSITGEIKDVNEKLFSHEKRINIIENKLPESKK